MKNQYDISEDGRTVTIWCYGRGKYHACLIDIADLPKVASIPGKWYLCWREYEDAYVVRYVTRGSPLLSRFITDAPKDKVVDYKNHDTLDNRRENLVVTSRSGVMMNRKPEYFASRGWNRGIIRLPKSGHYELWLQINRKRTYIGRFHTIEDAIAARNKYPEYA